jgi:hypothetical protein
VSSEGGDSVGSKPHKPDPLVAAAVEGKVLFRRWVVPAVVHLE